MCSKTQKTKDTNESHWQLSLCDVCILTCLHSQSRGMFHLFYISEPSDMSESAHIDKTLCDSWLGVRHMDREGGIKAL